MNIVKKSCYAEDLMEFFVTVFLYDLLGLDRVDVPFLATIF